MNQQNKNLRRVEGNKNLKQNICTERFIFWLTTSYCPSDANTKQKIAPDNFVAKLQQIQKRKRYFMIFSTSVALVCELIWALNEGSRENISVCAEDNWSNTTKNKLRMKSLQKCPLVQNCARLYGFFSYDEVVVIKNHHRLFVRSVFAWK